MLYSTLALIPLLPVLVNAQISLEILPEPSFHLLSAESIVLQQLGSWGVDLSLSLDLPVLNDVDLGVTIQPREEDEGEGSIEVAGDDTRRSRMRARGLSLNLGASGGVSSSSGVSGSTGSGLLGGLMSGVGSTVNGVVPSAGQSNGWGKADNVAKGEQGDQAVRPSHYFRYIS
jgi:hypothetical protein